MAAVRRASTARTYPPATAAPEGGHRALGRVRDGPVAALARVLPHRHVSRRKAYPQLPDGIDGRHGAAAAPYVITDGFALQEPGHAVPGRRTAAAAGHPVPPGIVAQARSRTTTW